MRATPLGDTATWEALARRWARFATNLHHHHSAEDEHYWPVLLAAAEARGTAQDLAEVHAMSEEHADIDPLVKAIRDGFAALVEHPCEEHRNALDIRIAGLREVLDTHLRHEETVVFPLVQRVMTPEQYEAVEKAIGTSYPVRGCRSSSGGPCTACPGTPARRCSPSPARPTRCCTPSCVAVSSGPRRVPSATATVAPGDEP